MIIVGRCSFRRPPFRLHHFVSRRSRSRSISTTPISPRHRTHLVFGANTDVGKTLVTAGLVRAGLHQASDTTAVHYMKPLQCGGSDQAFVEKYCPAEHHLQVSTLFRWETPASPHVAAMRENRPVSDEQVVSGIRKALQRSEVTTTASTTWIETAGGVLSPASASPSNNTPRYHISSSSSTREDPNPWGWTLQGDLYRFLQGTASVVLVGDGRLGGISCTLSALESLLARGYDVAALVVLAADDDAGGQGNIEALRDYAAARCLRSETGEPVLRSSQSIVSLPAIPADPSVPLFDWFEETGEKFLHLDRLLASQWHGQVSDLRQLAKEGTKETSTLWLNESVPVLDSVSHESMHVLTPDPLHIVEWNNTCLHGYTTTDGRYGSHPIPNTVTAPAVHLAQSLTQDDGDRVYFTSSATQAVETAIRMGIRTYQHRMKVTDPDEIQWIVATQEDGWHGDTLGSMSAAENYVEQDHPWYQPRGFCLPPARMGFQNGILYITPPEGMQHEPVMMDSIEKALDTKMRSLTKLFSLYKEMIEMQWLVKEHSSGLKIASVLMEPVLQFDVMKWVDPLWQRAMMEVADSRSIPVILDESRVGLYRLGHLSLRELLQKTPEVSVYAAGSLGIAVAAKDVYEACDDLAFDHQACARTCGVALDRLSGMETVYQAKPPRSRTILERESLVALSELEAVHDIFSLGSVCSIALGGETSEDLSAQLVDKLRSEEGIMLQQAGDVVYFDVSLFSERQELVAVLSRCIRSL